MRGVWQEGGGLSRTLNARHVLQHAVESSVFVCIGKVWSLFSWMLLPCTSRAYSSLSGYNQTSTIQPEHALTMRFVAESCAICAFALLCLQ